jgi:5'-nucleotidase
VVAPVQAFVESLDENVLARSEVALNGEREPGVRTEETNLGNLMADALLFGGRQHAGEFSVVQPDIALQNGGGIRNNSVIPPGPLTELDTFAIAPFSNFVSVVPDVPRSQVKEILENAVSAIPVADGRFAQVAGFRFTYDPSQQAQVVDDEGNVLTPGERVQSVVLDDGTVIVENGQVVDGDPIAIATNDFSARGGDQYPFRGLPFTTVGVTYQQALADYLVTGLNGLVSDEEYPEGGEGRIEQVDAG